MKTLYAIRNAKTGKYYNEEGRFTSLEAGHTWVMKKCEAEALVKDASFKRFTLEIVPVQLLRVD